MPQNFAALRQKYQGYTDAEIIGAIQSTQYPDYTTDEVGSALGWEPESRSRTWGEVAGDTGIAALKGAINLPQAVVGLVDIPFGGRIAKSLEEVGYRPEDAKKILDEWYSDPQKAALAKVQKAEGFVDTTVAHLQNPSTIATATGESVPMMLGGAGIARQLMTTFPKVAAWVAGALGEGIMGAGAAQEQIRSESLDGLTTPKQGAAAIASGVGTAAFGMVGGKLASSKLGQKIGIADIDTALAVGTFKPTTAGFFKSVAASGFTEGFLEEMPQSAWEQMTQNYALEKPLMEGVDKASASGLVTGVAMGGVFGGFNAAVAKPPTPPATPPDPLSTIVGKAAPLSALEYSPEQLDAANQIAARRIREIEEKYTGTTNREVDVNGVKMTIPGKDAQIVTPEEKAELEFLKSDKANPESIAKAYGMQPEMGTLRVDPLTKIVADVTSAPDLQTAIDRAGAGAGLTPPTTTVVAPTGLIGTPNLPVIPTVGTIAGTPVAPPTPAPTTVVAPEPLGQAPQVAAPELVSGNPVQTPGITPELPRITPDQPQGTPDEQSQIAKPPEAGQQATTPGLAGVAGEVTPTGGTIAGGVKTPDPKLVPVSQRPEAPIEDVATPDEAPTFETAKLFDAWLADKTTNDPEQLNPLTGDGGVALLTLKAGKPRNEAILFQPPQRESDKADERIVYRLDDGSLAWWENETGKVHTVSETDPRLTFKAGKEAAPIPAAKRTPFDMEVDVDGEAHTLLVADDPAKLSDAEFADELKMGGNTPAVNEAFTKLRRDRMDKPATADAIPTGGTIAGAPTTPVEPKAPKIPKEPAVEITKDTPVTTRQAQNRWTSHIKGVLTDDAKAAFKDGEEWVVLGGIPHVVSTDGKSAIHFKRNEQSPKNISGTAGFATPEAKSEYDIKKAKGIADPVATAIEIGDSQALADILYEDIKTPDEHDLPVILPDDKMIRLSVDPKYKEKLEARLKDLGFRVTDRSVPAGPDTPTTTGPERLSMSALYRPAKSGLEHTGADFQYNRKGQDTDVKLPKDATDAQIDKLLGVLKVENFIFIESNPEQTFGTFMFKEGIAENIDSATAFIGPVLIRKYGLSSKTGTRQAIKHALLNGGLADVQSLIDKYKERLTKLQTVMHSPSKVDDLLAEILAAYSKPVEYGEAALNEDGLALSRLLKNKAYGDNNIIRYSTKLALLFGVDENSTDQTNRIKKKDADIPPSLRLDEMVRRGMRDHRQGKDVDEVDFTSTFGFAGLDFGNWVNDTERQTNLNMVYDAMFDLADTTGLNPKILGLGGKLKLAIGAQGKGGKTAAWFVPAYNEINITKTKGDGTVAHEWQHALDHNLRAADGETLMEDLVNTLQFSATPEQVLMHLRSILRDTSSDPKNRNRPPKEAMFAVLTDHNKYYDATVYQRAKDRKTTFFKDALLMDSGGDKYYSKIEELLSRAFESMIFDKTKGGSPYLVGMSRADGYMTDKNGYGGTPYPTGEERVYIADQWKQALAQIDAETLAIKTYKPEFTIVHIPDLGWVATDQNGAGLKRGYSGNPYAMEVFKTKEDIDNSGLLETRNDRIATPLLIQTAAINKVIIETATNVDAIMKEMGLDAWPEIKNGSMSESMFDHMRKGWWPKNNAELTDFAVKAHRMGKELGQYAADNTLKDAQKLDRIKLKEAQEDFEAAAARYLGQRITDLRSTGSDDKAIYDYMVEKYRTMPTLGIRSDTSISNQAYSTPFPIAFISGLLTRVKLTDIMLEPTAGNGILALSANPKNVIAIELDERRAKNMELMQIGKITVGNALTVLDRDVRDQEADVVHANPPFGQNPDGPVDVKSWDGNLTKIHKLDHLIAIKALRGMADKGRAVLILGAQLHQGKDLPRNERFFLNWVYSNYNVADHFEIGGTIYAKMGTTYPLRVLVIAGRKQTNVEDIHLLFPLDFKADRVTNLDDLWSRYVQASNRSEKIVVGAGTKRTTPSSPDQQPGGVPTGDQTQDGIIDSGDGTGEGGAGGKGRSGRRGDTDTGVPRNDGDDAGSTGTGEQPADSADGARGKPRDVGTGKGRSGRTEGESGRTGLGDVSDVGYSDADLDAMFDDPVDSVKPIKQPKGQKTEGKKPKGQPKAEGSKKAPSSEYDFLGLGDLQKELEDAINGTPPAKVKKPKSPAKPISPTGSIFPPAPQLLLTMANPALSQAAFLPTMRAIAANNFYASEGNIRASLTRIAQNGTEPTGLYSRPDGTNDGDYAKYLPILAKVWATIQAKISDAKAQVTAFIGWIKQSLGKVVMPYAKRFFQESREDAKRAKLSDKRPVTGESVDSESQVLYICRSQGESDGIYLTQDQAQHTYAALDAIENQYGNIDDFVREELGYASNEEMFAALAGYQIDALALSFHNLRNGGGFIIGDDTGVGKGRTAAAAIVWAKKNGKIPIFFSATDGLYSDMYRDLVDIGHGDLQIGMTNTESAVIDVENNVIFENKKRQAAELVRYINANNKLPDGMDALFTSYKQMAGVGSVPRKEAILSLVQAGKAVIIMDEAHNAGGDSSTNAYFMNMLMATKLPSGDMSHTPPPTLYLTATFAKRANNMPVYTRTDLRHAAENPEALVAMFKNGGDVLQAIASMMLAEAGSMIRRERSYAGVVMNYVTDEANTPRDARLVDEVTTVLRAIVMADREFNAWLALPGVTAGLTATYAGGLNPSTQQPMFPALGKSPFTSLVHNYIGQLLLAAKIDNAVENVVASLNRGKKPVIALQNTMEAALDDYIKTNNARNGDELADFGWQTVLGRGRDAARRIRFTASSGRPADDIEVIVPYERMPQSLRNEFARVQQMIDAFNSPLQVSPIDAITHKLQQYQVWEIDDRTVVGKEAPTGVKSRPLKVAEITGRGQGVDYRHEIPRLYNIEKPGRRAIINGFQNLGGGIDVIILNSSGATGISLHAEVDKVNKPMHDQRPRHMFILQPNPDISVFKQMLGRIHRTGQVEWPTFSVMATGVPAERRIMAVLKKKMSAMVSNTSAGSSAVGVDAVDFINLYGDSVTAQYLNEHDRIQDVLRVPQYQNPEDAEGSGLALTASGRAALLSVDDQHDYYDSIEAAYVQEIATRDATNTNVLVRRFAPIQAEVLEASVLEDGLDENNPFTRTAYLMKVSMDIVGDVATANDVRDAVSQSLNGKTPRKVVDAIAADLQEAYTQARDQVTMELAEANAELLKPDLTNSVRNDLTAKIATGNLALAKFYERRTQTINNLTRAYSIGSGYDSVDVNDVVSKGVIVAITYTKSKSPKGNPFAPSNFRVHIQRNIPGGRAPFTLSKLESGGVTLTGQDSRPDLNDWFKLSGVTGGREIRYIAGAGLTPSEGGNILRARLTLEGQGGDIISFSYKGHTEETPRIGTGILMPGSFDPGNLAARDYRVRSVQTANDFLFSAWNAVLKDRGYDDEAKANEPFVKTFAEIPVDLVRANTSFIVFGSGHKYDMVLNEHSPNLGFRLYIHGSRGKDLYDQKKAFVKDFWRSLNVEFVKGSKNDTYLKSTRSIVEPADVAKVIKFLHARADVFVNNDLQEFASEIARTNFQVEQGKPLFSRNERTKGATVKKVEGWLSQAIAKIKNIDVRIVQSVKDLPDNAAPSDVEGAWYGGNVVYLVADNLGTRKRALGVLAHEAIGHSSLEDMLGEKGMNQLVKDVILMERAGNKVVKDLGEVVDRRQPGLSDKNHAKEIVALMAERDMQNSIMSRIIQAVRNFLRSIGIDSLVFNDHDIRALLRNAEKYADRGDMQAGTAGDVAMASRTGQIDTANPDVRYSRKGTSTLSDVTKTLQELTSPIGTVTFWDRTVGTQYHKSTKDADFKRVFDGYKQQTNDTAHYAIEAENNAPDILMRLESFGDIFKGLAHSGKKQKVNLVAVSKALFANIEGVKGIKQKKYNSAELKSLFNLTPKQIEMYHQARGAVDTSIDRLAQTFAAQMGRDHGMDIETLKNMTLDDTSTLVKEHIQARDDEARVLQKLAQEVAAQSEDAAIPKAPTETVTKTNIDRIDALVEHAKFLQETGYMPAMRFGEFAVTVVGKVDEAVFGGMPMADPVDEVLHFEMFESKTMASLAAHKLAKEYPNAVITKSVMNPEQYAMFKGVSPETVELFAKFNGMDQNEAYQNYIALAKSSRSVKKRELRRKGIAGFSEDATRVIASFVYSNARQSAINMNIGEITDALASKSLARKGDVQREAQKLSEYLKNPQEEARQLRSFMFMYFLGGSFASAAVNLTQTVMQTGPYLSQFTGAKTIGIMLKAMKQATTGNIDNAVLREAAKKAKEEGHTEPNEIHQLMADASNSAFGSNLKGRAVIKTWGSMFALAEAYNRRVTFLAAYQVALDIKNADPYAFAVKAIIETQGLYAKENRPNWARGPVGAVVFTFKQFTIAYLEFIVRLPNKQKAIALGILILAAGIQGLPGADDLDDLIDTIGQSMGHNTNSSKWKRKFLIDTFGEDLGNILHTGILSQGAIGASSRLSMGNLFPGTAMFKPSDPDKSRAVAELAGPISGILAAFQKALAKAQQGETGGALQEMSPVAIKNLLKGFEMASTGVYKDTKGGKVNDVDAMDSFVKMLGFQPGHIAQKSRIYGDEMQDKGMTAMMESMIADRWAQGIHEKDQDKVKRARETLAAWNKTNPGSRIVINPNQIRSRIRAMEMSRVRRFIKTVPKEQRRQVAGELQ